MRYLLQPGDCALVDDPGYYNMFGNLRMHGVEMLAVPRRPDGPDLAALEALAAARRPKVYFTQSAIQNPTGSSTSPHVAFRLLRAAERSRLHDRRRRHFLRSAVGEAAPPAATLDQLSRVIYVRSFSKTLSGSLRVGFRGLDAERGRRARRHQNADLHHDVAIHRTPALPHPCGRSLPKTLVAATGASRGGAGQCRAGFRANWTRNVYRADRRNVHLGAAGKHRYFFTLAEIRSERRHRARAWHRLSTASRTIALDAIQRGHLRRPSHLALARTTVSKSAESKPQKASEGANRFEARQVLVTRRSTPFAKPPAITAICAKRTLANCVVRHLWVREAAWNEKPSTESSYNQLIYRHFRRSGQRFPNICFTNFRIYAILCRFPIFGGVKLAARRNVDGSGNRAGSAPAARMLTARSCGGGGFSLACARA